MNDVTGEPDKTDKEFETRQTWYHQERSRSADSCKIIPTASVKRENDSFNITVKSCNVQ